MSTANRRAAVYIPKELDNLLKAFIADRNLKGDSPALIAILSEYFGVSHEVAPLKTHFENFVSREDFEALSIRVDEFAELSRNSNSKGELSSELLEKIESLERRLVAVESTEDRVLPSKEETLSTGELAKRLNMNSTTLSHWKGADPKRGKSPDELLKATRAKDPNGIGWILVTETNRFKPERKLPDSSLSKSQGELLPLEAI